MSVSLLQSVFTIIKKKKSLNRCPPSRHTVQDFLLADSLSPYLMHTSTKLLFTGAKVTFRVERGKDFPWIPILEGEHLGITRDLLFRIFLSC